MTRKINTTKVVALLAVLCMITSAFVGSTLAKYTTSANGADTARVAKFGVELTVENYNKTNSSFTDAYGTTVAAGDGALVVAPGTKNTDNNKIKFTISGTPEVATKIDIEVLNSDLADNSGPTDIFLGAKDGYIDYTVSPAGTFNLTSNYHPVRFTLTQTKGGSEKYENLTLAQLKETLEYWSANATYAPNTKLDAEFELTWAWNFENDDLGTGVTADDKADTLLGNIAADNKFARGLNATDYSTTIDYGIKFTVTQVD